MAPIASLLPVSQDIYRKIVFEIDDGVIGIDKTGIIRLCNPSAERIFGWEPGGLLEKHLNVMLPEHLHAFHARLVSGFFSGVDEARYMGARTAEIVGRRADGSDIHLGITILKTSTASVPMMIAVIRDISERISYQRELLRLAQTDPLTGLLNRRAFYESFAARMALGEPAISSVALLDLDEFKALNDRYGHDAGDETIIRFADILRQTIRSADLAARWGGEEFILFLPDTSSQSAVAVVERVRAAFADAVFDWRRGGSGSLTVSAGIVTDRIGKGGLDAAVARADIALYDAKRGGRNRIVRIRDPQDTVAMSADH
ncbi:sensor domain-containing diguanylate cyclase [Pseudorhizobium halotolerans]|uniref:diguanylate cyclase n=1 Tax=Pseudorhizobium halotolerans TaxID=1233081 RepID=A0ABM8PNY2_9HYPH|nr:sensor domain-containing diguanylate cyclase [Pseudorhizobium halotolerans]CAD7039956.1 sensor domain-containing diguanylate cyclase [Pseudorhizobium halotolerans]